jgi:hypothetical protein
MTTTIRLNYSCTLTIPADMKASEVSALFELLSRCNKVDSLWADAAKESIDYVEPVEVTIKRVPMQYSSKEEASVRAAELNVAAGLAAALKDAAAA